VTHHSAAHPTALTNTRDPRPALLGAAIVACVILLQQIVGLLQSLSWIGDAGYVTEVVLPFLRGVLVDVLAFSAGVFLLFWLLPARTADRVALVLGKGLVAAAAGVVLSTVVGFLVLLVMSGISTFRDLPYYSGYNPFLDLFPQLLGRAPLVMLVALVLWVVRRVPRS